MIVMFINIALYPIDLPVKGGKTCLPVVLFFEFGL